MARWKGTTAERGYGTGHQSERRHRLAVHRIGNPCAIGGEPLMQAKASLDLAHDHVNGGYLPGLACRYHNRQEGASRGNQSRQFKPAAAGSDVRCPICGRPYSRAARSCEMCGAHYHPSYGQQRTCGRQCGIELRRRHKDGYTARPSKPRPLCKICGKPCSGLRNTYCSQECASQGWRRTWPSSKVMPYICQSCGKAGVAHGRQSQQVCPACSTRSCAVPGCDRPVFFATTDWCAPHHHRHQQHGDVLADVPVAADRADRMMVATAFRRSARRW